MQLEKILNNNESIYVRIQYILEFYGNKENYPNNILIDNGTLANSLLLDLEKIDKEYIIDNNVFDIDDIRAVNEYILNLKK